MSTRSLFVKAIATLAMSVAALVSPPAAYGGGLAEDICNETICLENVSCDTMLGVCFVYCPAATYAACDEPGTHGCQPNQYAHICWVW